jgi:hypothetical protein
VSVRQYQILNACFAVFASGDLVSLSRENWKPLLPLVPAVALCGLFFSSTTFSEGISKQKYPKTYSAYQARVGMFTPLQTILQGLFLSAVNQKRAAEVKELVWGDPTKVKSD